MVFLQGNDVMSFLFDIYQWSKYQSIRVRIFARMIMIFISPIVLLMSFLFFMFRNEKDIF